MKYLLWILLLFSAAVALVTVSHNPGYALLVYPPYRIELSLTLFIAFFIILFALGYGLVRMLIATIQLPGYVRKFRIEHAKNKARQLLDDALGAFFEGRYAAAEKASARAMELGDTSALHPIIAARSAHELRNYKKRDAYLSATGDKSSGETTMRLMATAKFMLDQHNPHAALKTLQELRNSGVKDHLGALSLELKAQQQAGNWDEVMNVLEQLEKREAIETTTAAQLRQQIWLEKIQQQDTLAGLTECLKKIPSDLKRRGKIAASAARALIRQNGCALAQQLLSDSLNTQWDSDLVRLYGDCKSENGIAQIEQAEKWLNQHKDDAGLLLALGKLCMHQKLWGKAQNYMDASISITPSHAAYTALGQLAEGLGKPNEAFKYYQHAMDMANLQNV